MRRLSRRSRVAAKPDARRPSALILTGTPADKHAKLQVLPAIKPLDVEELACPLERNGDFLSKLTWPDACVWCRMHGIPKRFVYILRSRVDLSRHYVGITNDLAARLEWHNHGPCGHTVSHRPWSMVVSLEFATEKEAVRFEVFEVRIGPGIRGATFWTL